VNSFRNTDTNNTTALNTTNTNFNALPTTTNLKATDTKNTNINTTRTGLNTTSNPAK
jgi:hypothetical protein